MRRTTCWPGRPPAAASSAAPWSARDCSAASRAGSTSSPTRPGSRRATPADPQAPAISVIIPGFSRPVLHFSVALRDDLAPPRSSSPTSSPSCRPEIDDEPWYDESFSRTGRPWGGAWPPSAGRPRRRRCGCC
jgi:hypothetical protein